MEHPRTETPTKEALLKTISFSVPCYNSTAYMDHCDETLLAAGEDLLVQGALKRVNLRIVDQPMVEEAQNLHVVIIVAGRVPC